MSQNVSEITQAEFAGAREGIQATVEGASGLLTRQAFLRDDSMATGLQALLGGVAGWQS
jgi:hypothetical protein